MLVFLWSIRFSDFKSLFRLFFLVVNCFFVSCVFLVLDALICDFGVFKCYFIVGACHNNVLWC